MQQFGHTHMYYPVRKKNPINMAEVKEVEDKDEKYSLYYLALSSEINSNKNTWIVDSGASRHTTRFRDKFETLEEYSIEVVTIGDNSTYPMQGIGICLVHLSTRVNLHLKNVLFVPGIKINHISIYGLADQGYQIAFQEKKVLCWMKNSNIKNAISIGVALKILFLLKL